MRYLLFLPAVFFFALMMYGIRHDRKKVAAKAAAKAERAAQRTAKRETCAESSKQPKASPAPSVAAPVQAVQANQPTSAAAPVQAAPADRLHNAPQFAGNNVFAREVVAFTGTLDGMNRQEAINAVTRNGGKAFDSMPACTTLLVIGKRPGANKTQRAEQYGVRTITQDHFKALLTAPLTLTPDEFAAHFAPKEA